MDNCEYLTLYITQRIKPGNGDGPTYTYSVSVGEEPDSGEVTSAESVALALESYQRAGWTLIALLLTDDDGVNKTYQVTLRREIP